MIVAGLQMDIAWEEPGENFRKVEEMAPGAASVGAQLMVLPEMFATGFSMDSVRMAAFAEKTRAVLAHLARTYSCHVLGGYAEPADPRPANACSIFDPSGEEILHYRKLHPFAMAGEDEHFFGGDSIETAVVEGVRVTPLICYDLRFPEPFRAAAAGTDLYCVIANWPSPRRDAWSTLLKARAIENQAWVLGVNRVGVHGDHLYPGDSALHDPLGADAARGGPRPRQPQDVGQEGVVWGKVDPARVTEVREGLGFLQDRKPELYRKLEEDRG